MDTMLTCGVPAHVFTKEDAIKGGSQVTPAKKTAAKLRGLRLTSRPLKSFEVLCTDSNASLQQLYAGYTTVWNAELSVNQRIKMLEIGIKLHEACFGRKILNANIDVNKAKETIQSWYDEVLEPAQSSQGDNVQGAAESLPINNKDASKDVIDDTNINITQ